MTDSPHPTDEQIIRAALPEWGLPATAGLRLLNISENATYRVDAGESWTVRLHRSGYHGADEIASELAWLAAVGAEGRVAVPRIRPTRRGEALLAHGGRHLACFSFEPGKAPTRELPRWFRELGRTAALLHDHARRFGPPPGFRRKRWTHETIIGPRAYWGDWRQAPGLDRAGRAVLEAADARLARDCAALGTGAAAFGLIHCDMRLANLLVDGPRLTVIDFDDCGFCWYGYDFAAAVSFMEHDPAVPALQAAWLAGYREVAPFGQEDALPMLVMLRRMQLTAWIASHAGTDTARALGPGYTAGTVAMAGRFLARQVLSRTKERGKAGSAR